MPPCTFGPRCRASPEPHPSPVLIRSRTPESFTPSAGSCHFSGDFLCRYPIVPLPYHSRPVLSIREKLIRRVSLPFLFRDLRRQASAGGRKTGGGTRFPGKTGALLRPGRVPGPPVFRRAWKGGNLNQTPALEPLGRVPFQRAVSSGTRTALVRLGFAGRGCRR